MFEEALSAAGEGAFSGPGCILPGLCAVAAESVRCGPRIAIAWPLLLVRNFIFSSVGTACPCAQGSALHVAILGRSRAAGQIEFSREFPAWHFIASHCALFNSFPGSFCHKKESAAGRFARRRLLPYRVKVLGA
jgi:hypothetical protein